MRNAWNMGRKMPIEIDAMYPVDESVKLEPEFALRGRNRDGTNTDANTPLGPDSANATAIARAAADEIEFRLMSELEAALNDLRQQEKEK